MVLKKVVWKKALCYNGASTLHMKVYSFEICRKNSTNEQNGKKVANNNSSSLYVLKAHGFQPWKEKN